MNTPTTAFLLLAQVAGEAAASPAVGLPWWQTRWSAWLITLGVLIIPTLLAWMITKSLRLSDMWGRLATVLVALAAGGVICWLGWPPRLGIDLKGGLILVYEVAAGRQGQLRVDDAVAGIERIMLAEDGSNASLEQRPGGKVRVRLDTADTAAREAFLAEMKQAQLDQVAVREVAREAGPD